MDSLFYRRLGKGLVIMLTILLAPILISKNYGLAFLQIYTLPAVLFCSSCGSIVFRLAIIIQTILIAYLIGGKNIRLKATIFAIAYFTISSLLILFILIVASSNL